MTLLPLRIFVRSDYAIFFLTMQTKRRILGPEFFDRPVLVVAKELLGEYLVRKINGKTVALMITETDAYGGLEARASHSSHGQTLRNAPMFGEPGTIYVYFTYGMHWMLNLVCGKKGRPSAVLIRGADGFHGPGRVTKSLKIDRKLNGKILGKKVGLWVEDWNNRKVKNKLKITKTPRVGIDYSGPVWSKKLHRFVLENK